MSKELEDGVARAFRTGGGGGRCDQLAAVGEGSSVVEALAGFGRVWFGGCGSREKVDSDV